VVGIKAKAYKHMIRCTQGKAPRGAYLKSTTFRSKVYSMIPVVGTRTRRMSCRVGTYPGAVILSKSLR